MSWQRDSNGVIGCHFEKFFLYCHHWSGKTIRVRNAVRTLDHLGMGCSCGQNRQKNSLIGPLLQETILIGPLLLKYIPIGPEFIEIYSYLVPCCWKAFLLDQNLLKAILIGPLLLKSIPIGPEFIEIYSYLVPCCWKAFPLVLNNNKIFLLAHCSKMFPPSSSNFYYPSTVGKWLLYTAKFKCVENLVNL